MEKLTKLLRWLDDNLIRILILGFVFIVPLYPKFPIKIIDYTYIAIRAEDFYIALLTILFCVQVIRQKVHLNLTFGLFIVLFWLAAFSSFLWGAYVQNTVIYKHLGLLHAARRVEYMIIFFIAASSISTKAHFLFYLRAIFVAMFFVCLYGMGQKFLGWPAIQTMNPEFAKGHLLILTPEARVSSTFAGHYDLAAYFVLLIPIIVGMFMYTNNWIYYLIAVVAIFLLNLTASRISAISYVVSMLTFIIFTRKIKIILLILFATALSASLSNDTVQRFLKTVQIKQIFVNESTGEVVVPQKITSKELPAGTFYIQITQAPKGDQSGNEKLLRDKLMEEIQREASDSNTLLSSEEAELRLATRTAGLKPQNTVVADISFATRLQVEWPRAFNAFKKNPILGTGPSSITEATDNDYLRWLGEFGLLGTTLFLYIIFLLVKTVFYFVRPIKTDEKYLFYGYIFGVWGLLMNASYIDVFEASKVAYTFWLIAGIFIGYITNAQKKATH